MTTQIELLTERYENQIELAFDTLVEIQKLETIEWPARHLSDWHEIAIWMMFFWVLTRAIWDKMEKADMTHEQRLKIITECGNASHEHFLELYWFDSRRAITN